MYLGLGDPSGGHWRTDSTGSLHKRRPRSWLGLAPRAYGTEEALHICFFFKKRFIYFFLNSMCAHAWVYHKHTSTGTRGIQMWVSDRLELELHAMMCCLMWVLGTECGSLGRAANTYSVSHHFSSWPHTFLA